MVFWWKELIKRMVVFFFKKSGLQKRNIGALLGQVFCVLHILEGIVNSPALYVCTVSGWCLVSNFSINVPLPNSWRGKGRNWLEIETW